MFEGLKFIAFLFTDVMSLTYCPQLYWDDAGLNASLHNNLRLILSKSTNYSKSKLIRLFSMVMYCLGLTLRINESACLLLQDWE